MTCPLHWIPFAAQALLPLSHIQLCVPTPQCLQVLKTNHEHSGGCTATVLESGGDSCFLGEQLSCGDCLDFERIKAKKVMLIMTTRTIIFRPIFFDFPLSRFRVGPSTLILFYDLAGALLSNTPHTIRSSNNYIPVTCVTKKFMMTVFRRVLSKYHFSKTTGTSVSLPKRAVNMCILFGIFRTH